MKKLLAFFFLGVGVAVATRKPRRRAVPRPTPKPTPSPTTTPVGGMESDAPLFDPDDEPPPPEAWDHRPPCETFEQRSQSEGPGGRQTETGFMVTRGGGSCTPPWDLVPEQRTSAPLAQVPEIDVDKPRPLWPINTDAEEKVVVSYKDVRGMWHGKWGYHVGSKRKGDDGSKRYHSGVDLFADDGDVVVAMEDGEVIAMLPFHHDTWGVYVRNKDGQVVNYGEVKKNSWTEFGFPLQVIEGETQTIPVKAGQPLARVGVQSGGSTMLHLETYDGDVTLADIRAGNMRWHYGENAPLGLLDPSSYLVAAQHTWYFARGEDVT